MNAILTDQGQVTLPENIRDALGLMPGSRVEFDLEQGRAILRKANDTNTQPDRFRADAWPGDSPVAHR